MGRMTAPTLVGPRVTLRAFSDDDRAARQRHGWHREIERGYGDDTADAAMTDDEVERLGRLPGRQVGRRRRVLGDRERR